jgi:glycosyltransferase involved in cell wall biosynthesis
MKKLKIGIFVHQLQIYRLPIISLLAEKYDVSVFCDNASDYERASLNFMVIRRKVIQVGPFLMHSKNIIHDCKEMDVVIALWNLRCLDLLFLGLMRWRLFGLIYWGIGTSGSYTKKFGSKSFTTVLRNLMGVLADAVIVYSSFPTPSLKATGMSGKRIFIANNTVANTAAFLEGTAHKNSILFIGSLYKEKGIADLIASYNEGYCDIGSLMPDLDIIGDGSESETLRGLVNDLGLESKINFHGSIFDDHELAEYFNRAIICVSPRQAGLSVLKAMSFGICFVTSNDAITGGEILNIDNGRTGICYHNKSDLTSILTEAALHPQRFLAIGKNAKEYYEAERRPDQMADGISDAVEFVGGLRRP